MVLAVENGSGGDDTFLVEHRRQIGYDRTLPGQGLLVYHIDDAIEGNENENHPKIKLVEADNQSHLHNGINRGDDGDCYPGRAGNRRFDAASSPNSKTYGGVDTCVAVTGITTSGTSIKANLRVTCASGVAPRAGRSKPADGRVQRSKARPARSETRAALKADGVPALSVNGPDRRELARIAGRVEGWEPPAPPDTPEN
jgi:immune inhibitor A